MKLCYVNYALYKTATFLILTNKLHREKITKDCKFSILYNMTICT